MSFEDFYSNEFNLIGVLKNVKSPINVPSLWMLAKSHLVTKKTY